MSKKREGDRFEHLEFDDESIKIPIEEEKVRPEASGLLASEPMETHAYRERAIQAFQQGEFEKALRYFTRALELDRKFVPAWVGQVQMLVELDELREAGLWADKALELFRDQGELLSAKAVVKARLRDRQGAMGCSDAALAARGTTAYRWLARGEVLLASGAAQVEACFDRAMLEQDADWFTRLWSARIYRRYAKSTNAVVAARAATELAPQAPFAWFIRGLCERDLAIAGYRTSLERALEIDGGFALARAALREPQGVSWLQRWYRRIRGE